MFDFALMNSCTKTTDPPKQQQKDTTPHIKKYAVRVSSAEIETFKRGFSWLNSRLPDLMQAGWTRPELFRRNRARRGIAWLSLWNDPEVTVSLTPEKFILFTITRQDRVCRQTARPCHHHGAPRPALPAVAK